MNRRAFVLAPVSALLTSDSAFLEDFSRRSLRFFIEHADPQTGLIRDRARTNGELSSGHSADVASIAGTGFGLTAFCIAAERQWMERRDAERRVVTALRFLRSAANVHGWYYHFLGIRDGIRRYNCEVSSVDTAFLLAGILTARQYFSSNTELVRIATELYDRVDFGWMLDGHPYLLSHGWYPERGFSRFRWNKYSEQMVLYLLAIASRTFAIPIQSWHAWSRPGFRYGRHRYFSSVSPLFVHQFSHAWVDFRSRRELRPPHIDWFQNSVVATRAHRDFCIALAKVFPKSYGPNLWGISASDSAKGYRAWGGPPADASIDGTLVPNAPAGSLMFAPDLCVSTLRTMRERFGDRVYGRYSFADAFNPTTGWVDTDVIGIDLGIGLLSAENLRDGFIWRWFMANSEIAAVAGRVLSAGT